LVSEEVARYGKGDRLLHMKVSAQARKRNPDLPTHWEVRGVSYAVKDKIKTVLTSLPADTYSAKTIAKLYQERWEIELGFRDIKSSLQQDAMTLRSKVTELVYQEVWGLLLAYNIIRREAGQAAVAFGRSPGDIRSEEHTSELQSRENLVCRLLLEKKKPTPRPPRAAR